ncbi:MAG: AAA family ATPase [Candidatus Kapabacteria bacterium]|nr:AAA family ATPase [Candidatus Kapabacteria bacterium]
MIQELRLRNYRSVRDVTLKLGRVNLLIGPNNSGKTNILKAITFFGEMVRGKVYSEAELERLHFGLANSFLTNYLYYSPELSLLLNTNFIIGSRSHSSSMLCYLAQHKNLSRDGFVLRKYYSCLLVEFKQMPKHNIVTKFSATTIPTVSELNSSYARWFRAYFAGDFKISSEPVNGQNHSMVNYLIENSDIIPSEQNQNSQFLGNSYYWTANQGHITKQNTVPEYIDEAIQCPLSPSDYITTQIYHIEPSLMKQGYPTKSDEFLDSDGGNIVSLLDLMRDKYQVEFNNIKRDISLFIPEFEDISFERVELDKKDPLRLKYPTDTIKKLGLKDKQGNIYWADELSDGTLYFLALLCIIHQPNPSKLLLIEEPETGIHPRRIREALDLIYSLAEEKDLQVIITTHSPQVVDYFSDIPECVHIVDKVDGETNVKNLQHDIIDDRNKKYKEAGVEPVPYTEELGENWMMGFLGGVPYASQE